MGKSFSIRGANRYKFTGGIQVKSKEARKNILMDDSLHELVISVCIEEEKSIKGFVLTAIKDYVDDMADVDSGPLYRQLSGKVINTTVFLPRELVKDIKRIANHSKTSENQLIIRCLVKKLKSLKDKYPDTLNNPGIIPEE